MIRFNEVHKSKNSQFGHKKSDYKKKKIGQNSKKLIITVDTFCDFANLSRNV